MPSPREQALKIGTVPEKFRSEADEGKPASIPEPKEPDYRANPKNPRDDGPPVKNLKE